MDAGADEYLVKPILPNALDKFLERFSLPGRHGQSNAGDREANADGQANGGARLKFWGVRGSIPSPGPETVFYGGNTSCVEVRVGSDIIVLDAGSGIRRLGLALVEEFKERPMQLNLLITHTHWDHIQGFPFFLPAYDPKNNVTIYGFEGASQGLRGTLCSLDGKPLFPHQPATNAGAYRHPGTSRAGFLREPRAGAGPRPESSGQLHRVPPTTMTPGGSISCRTSSFTNGCACIGARRQIGPDALHGDFAVGRPRSWSEFIRDSDVLIIDSQYDADEYETYPLAGAIVALEDSRGFRRPQANVKHLFLFHHDPDHTDEQISRMVARARQMASRAGSNLIIEAAREGTS